MRGFARSVERYYALLDAADAPRKGDTPQGKVRFGLPLHALRFYFPGLWPDAEADAQG